jgi:hypothetical protein
MDLCRFCVFDGHFRMDKDSFGSDLVGRVIFNVKDFLVTDASCITGIPPPQRHNLYLDDVNQKVQL